MTGYGCRLGIGEDICSWRYQKIHNLFLQSSLFKLSQASFSQSFPHPLSPLLLLVASTEAPPKSISISPSILALLLLGFLSEAEALVVEAFLAFLKKRCMIIHMRLLQSCDPQLVNELKHMTYFSGSFLGVVSPDQPPSSPHPLPQSSDPFLPPCPPLSSHPPKPPPFFWSGEPEDRSWYPPPPLKNRKLQVILNIE